MSKIYVFSGSHGVGKTTLTNKIASYFEKDESVKLFKEFNTGLFNMGFSLNGKGLDFDEVLFSQKSAFDLYYNTINYYLTHSSGYSLILIDRSCIDTFVYTKYFAMFNQLSDSQKSVIEDMEAKVKEIFPKINHILLSPFNDFDKKERMTQDSQYIIWEEFRSFFSIQESIGNVTLLKGDSTDLRYKEFFQLLGLSQSNYSEDELATEGTSLLEIKPYPAV